MDRDDKLVREAIEIFRSGKTKSFDVATEKLKKANVSETMGLMLLQLAAELPKFPDEFFQPHAKIAESATRVFNPKYFEQIKKDHLKYNKETWQEVIRFLAQASQPMLPKLYERSCCRRLATANYNSGCNCRSCWRRTKLLLIFHI